MKNMTDEFIVEMLNGAKQGKVNEQAKSDSPENTTPDQELGDKVNELFGFGKAKGAGRERGIKAARAQGWKPKTKPKPRKGEHPSRQGLRRGIMKRGQEEAPSSAERTGQKKTFPSSTTTRGSDAPPAEAGNGKKPAETPTPTPATPTDPKKKKSKITTRYDPAEAETKRELKKYQKKTGSTFGAGIFDWRKYIGTPLAEQAKYISNILEKVILTGKKKEREQAKGIASVWTPPDPTERGARQITRKGKMGSGKSHGAGERAAEEYLKSVKK
jgi:hypothetical protein